MASSWDCVVHIGIILGLLLSEALALICYECTTMNQPECGPRFKSYAINMTECTDEQIMCALQRQRAIPEKRQLAAIARGCYQPGQVPGINESIGCRKWTNAKNYTAEYCFCNTDYCNHGNSLHLSIAMVTLLAFFASSMVFLNPDQIICDVLTVVTRFRL